MRNHILLMLSLAALGATAMPAGAAPYWYTYEGDALPEDEGWGRRWGNWDGLYEGDGAIRTVEDGILTMDSLYDTGVHDYAYVERPGATDPDPEAGEVFVVEWRAQAVETAGEPSWDSGMLISSDDAWKVSLGLFPDKLRSTFEEIDIPITPGEFHDYRFISSDMRTYELYIDSEHVHSGTFWEGLTGPYIRWGDVRQGVASLTYWDYVRVGVVPEPSSLFMCCVLLSCATWMFRNNHSI